MTIQEIIAKYTRTGLVPQSYAIKDDGGNVATEPDFDPLDEYSDIVRNRAAAGLRDPAHSGQKEDTDLSGMAKSADPAKSADTGASA